MQRNRSNTPKARRRRKQIPLCYLLELRRRITMLKRARNLKSGVRTLSVTVPNGTTHLGVNLNEGAAPGIINKYNVEFKNGASEPLIDCLDCGKVLGLFFKKEIAKMDTHHIDPLLKWEGYFTKW